MWQTVLEEYQPYVFLLIGVCLLLVSAFFKSKKSNLKETGIPADGIIYEQEAETSFTLYDSSSQPEKKVTVRFLTLDEQWITGFLDQDFSISYIGQYKNGDSIRIYYDKDNPSNFYVDTNQSERKGRLLCAFVGLIFTIIGLWKIFF